jgi:hypothetical protein
VVFPYSEFRKEHECPNTLMRKRITQVHYYHGYSAVCARFREHAGKPFARATGAGGKALRAAAGPKSFTGSRVSDGLSHKRGRRHLDLSARDVGCCAANAERGHHVVALPSFGFDMASAPHGDALLNRKAVG